MSANGNQNKQPAIRDAIGKMLTALKSYDALLEQFKPNIVNDGVLARVNQIIGRIRALQTYYTDKLSTDEPPMPSVQLATPSNAITFEHVKEKAIKLAEPVSKIIEVFSVLRDAQRIIDVDGFDEKSFDQAERALTNVRDLIINIPERAVKAVLDRISEIEINPSDADLQKVRDALLAYDDIQRREAIHLAEMLTSDDVVGVVLRGHITVEKALRRLVDAFLPVHEHQLWGRRGLSFERTVHLCSALGLISVDERALLLTINIFRNKLAHTDAKIDAEDQRMLWTRFIGSTDIDASAWDTFDSRDFPSAIVHVIIYLHVVLESRAKTIAKAENTVERWILQKNKLDIMAFSAITRILVRLVPKVEVVFKEQKQTA